jgi:4-diphosphocytidyl-2-C-methyl-D-erythritol kinase
VPFFIYGKPAFVSGKGEKVSKYGRKGLFWYVVVVHKDIQVATKDAYDWYDHKINLTNDKSYTNIMYGYKKGVYAFLYNDFESVIYGRYPRLKKIRDSLLKLDCVDACLSGSGSAVYAMFDGRKAALEGYKTAVKEWKGSFVGFAHSI